MPRRLPRDLSIECFLVTLLSVPSLQASRSSRFSLFQQRLFLLFYRGILSFLRESIADDIFPPDDISFICESSLSYYFWFWFFTVFFFRFSLALSFQLVRRIFDDGDYYFTLSFQTFKFYQKII